jgi:hypothetical protein
MAFSEELKKKVSDAAILAEIDKLEGELSDVTRESIGRKTKIRDFESKYGSLTDKIKRLGLDPDKDDVEEQFAALLEASKKGLKPESEMTALMKKVEKLSTDLNGWKTQAEKATAEAEMAKARAAFSGKLGDHFGKASDILLDYATLKGIIAVKDGVPGVSVDDDFVPLTVDKGPGAIDVLKKLYPQFAITKQQPGGKDVSTRPEAGSGDKKTLSMNEFEALPHAEKAAYVKEGGKVE